MRKRRGAKMESLGKKGRRLGKDEEEKEGAREGDTEGGRVERACNKKRGDRSKTAEILKRDIRVDREWYGVRNENNP